MRVKAEEVEFRISDRILWIGTSAYPLSQVSSVRPIEYRMRLRPTLEAYGRRAGAILGLGLVALLVLACLGKAAPVAFTVIVVVAVTCVLAWQTVELIRWLWLWRGKVHILRVSTAGNQHSALVSRNGELIEELTRKVTDAINDPDLYFRMFVENLEITHGNRYDGDHVEGNKFGDPSTAQ